MNAFFDGYVHSKTSLKQFVEQYERALRSKVEKEFQADFRSFSQMVPCATAFEMEKQFQAVYTIPKFKEVQQEFIGKVYCDIVSENTNDHFWTTYDVREHVVYQEHTKKKTFHVSLRKESCELICSCHLFEFRGIICRHAIAILIRNDITTMPDRYILRRWRRDVSRAHTRVAVNYDGLVSTPEQLRYDDMCRAFSEVTDLTANDDGWTCTIMDRIKSQASDLRMSISSIRNAGRLQNMTNMGSTCNDSLNTSTTSILDPVSSSRKGAPTKRRRKGPLEKVTSLSNKGKKSRARPRCTKEAIPTVQASQHSQSSRSSPLSSSQNLLAYNASQTLPPTNVIINAQGDVMPNYSQHLASEGSTGFF
ncbi:protein FAR-RED IMPAIRED RESPONSE 1-like [Olea europaea var. sylvestris]|uniref:protein FAR-RED IMPAIRED RESPONSE 1-like n=1 Tax=Olea europaea var. sylvestris TaxID=158386 RepID=UPI000C1CE595|nr:protein FAR-RED IMPAIRED RESPONSE 1-like [Olea europaea var. sylvestris]